MNIRQLTRISLLSALIFVGRMSFSFLPNVQPMTVLLVLITLHFGFKEGLLVSTLSILISNLYMGMGPWTLAQIVAFGLLILTTKGLSIFYTDNTKIIYIFYVGVAGLLYGFFISLVQAPFFGWASFLPYYIAGIPYDAMHAIGNIGFWILLEPIMSPLFIRVLLFKQK